MTSTLGYQGRDRKFSYVQVTDAFIGPTIAHETISVAVADEGKYHITNVDSGKVIPIDLPVDPTTLTILLPDPSAGTSFTFVITSTSGSGDAVMLATGAQMTAAIASLPAYISAGGATQMQILSTSSIGDGFVFTGVSQTQWQVTGIFVGNTAVFT